MRSIVLGSLHRCEHRHQSSQQVRALVWVQAEKGILTIPSVSSVNETLLCIARRALTKVLECTNHEQAWKAAALLTSLMALPGAPVRHRVLPLYMCLPSCVAQRAGDLCAVRCVDAPPLSRYSVCSATQRSAPSWGWSKAPSPQQALHYMQRTLPWTKRPQHRMRRCADKFSETLPCCLHRMAWPSSRTCCYPSWTPWARLHAPAVQQVHCQDLPLLTGITDLNVMLMASSPVPPHAQEEQGSG